MVLLVAVAGGGGTGQVTVLDGGGETIVDLGGFEDVLGAMGQGQGFFAAVIGLGSHQAQGVVTHGVHGSGSGTDVLGFFGFYQDKDDFHGNLL
mgnify:CR=1 FL=1